MRLSEFPLTLPQISYLHRFNFKYLRPKWGSQGKYVNDRQEPLPELERTRFCLEKTLALETRTAISAEIIPHRRWTQRLIFDTSYEHHCVSFITIPMSKLPTAARHRPPGSKRIWRIYFCGADIHRYPIERILLIRHFICIRRF